MVRRLQRAGHQCVVYNRHPEPVDILVKEGAIGARSLEESVPAPVLGAALYERFSSRSDDDFAEKLLSALRFGFGGHKKKSAVAKGIA